MYKYLQMRPEKSNKASRANLEDANTGEDDEIDNIDNDKDSDAEDPELESFVNAEMDKEMKRMAQGAPGGMPDSDEEDLSMD